MACADVVPVRQVHRPRHCWQNAKPNAAFVEKVTGLEFGAALDLGCGEGADATLEAGLAGYRRRQLWRWRSNALPAHAEETSVAKQRYRTCHRGMARLRRKPSRDHSRSTP